MSSVQIQKECKLHKRKLLALYFSNNSNSLLQEINQCFSSKFGPGAIISDESNEKADDNKQDVSNVYKPCSYIVPHGAFCDAGPITAWSFHHLYNNLKTYYNKNNKLPSTLIIIGTNHRHIGDQISISSQIWTTPFGDIYPNMNIINRLNQKYKIKMEHIAHSKEHSIENQLPFIQYIYSQFKHNNNFTIVPILISYCKSVKQSKTFALNIINCMKELNIDLYKDIVIIGTTDFTHAGKGYGELPPKGSNIDLLSYTKTQDKYVIDIILSDQNDNDKLIEMILQIQQKWNNSMCGLWSMIVTILCSKYIGFNDIKLLKYAVSSEVMFREDVTGFASFVMQ
eukprot:235857_1